MIRATLSIVLFMSTCTGQTLREAVETSDIGSLRAILEAGEDPNTTYENEKTVVFFADDPRVVDLLVSHGARLDIRDTAARQTPIEAAAEKHYREHKRQEQWKAIVRALRDAGAEYTLDTAIYLNDIAQIEDVLKADGSWVNEKGGGQSVPLRLAARTGRTQICKLLLDRNADPDSFEEGNGYPIIVDAVEQPSVIQLLIEHGANLQRRITWHGIGGGPQIIGDEATILHYAVRAANLDSVSTLLNAGLDPNAADNAGQTPLHVAIRFERMASRSEWEDPSELISMVDLLLQNHASLRLTTKDRKTAVGLAREVKSPQRIIQLLIATQRERERAVLRAFSPD